MLAIEVVFTMLNWLLYLNMNAVNRVNNTGEIRLFIRNTDLHLP